MTKYSPRYIIPNWDDRGNHQMFIMSAPGVWSDMFNEILRSQEWIDAHIAPHYILAPDDISFEDYISAREIRGEEDYESVPGCYGLSQPW